jgi:cell division cycle 20-like protein 1 (cofactor of APC complex)
VPYKVLDAPNLADDFYLNLLDWGAQNVVAVGLEKEVYLWNGFTANVTKLTSLANKVNSVRWSGRGGHLMVGAEDGMVKLWDAVASRELRKLKTHSLRVGVGAWAGPLLATGSKDKQIHLHDVRSKAKFEHKLTSHTHEVRVVLLCLWPCVCTRFSLSLSLSHTHTRTRAHTHV